MSDKQWFIEQFDLFVSETGDDGAELEKSRDAVAHAYADAVETDQLDRWETDLVSEGRALFDQVVKSERNRRKGGMRVSMQYLLDALAGDTILGQDDPTLGLAYPIGDGRDKTLRLWTQDDWQLSTTERYRNAANVTNAAATFDAGAMEFIDQLSRRHLRITGDLFK